MTMKRTLAALAALALALAAVAVTATVGSRSAEAQVTCPTTLPPATNFTTSTTTQGQFKTNLTNLVAYLTCLLGTDGTTPTAKTTLGLSTVATSGSYADLSGKPTSLPPSGAAGGDLAGTYPNPTLAPGGGSLASLLQGHVGGLALANDGVSPQTVIDTSAGVATSDDATTMLKLASLTKSTSAWSVGSGNGCLDSGSVAASTWYHLFVIERTDTGVVDELCSISATAPTLPTSYTKKRRIGSFKTDASSHIIRFTQYGDGNRRQYQWNGGRVADIAGQALTSANRTLYTLASVPLGLKVDALIVPEAAWIGGGSTSNNPVEITSPDEADNTTQSELHTANSGYTNNGGRMLVRTNTLQQVGARTGSSGSIQISIATIGWYDDI